MISKLLGSIAQNMCSVSLVVSVENHREILANLCEAPFEIRLLLSLLRDTSSWVEIVHLEILSVALDSLLWPWRSRETVRILADHLLNILLLFGTQSEILLISRCILIEVHSLK